MNDLTYIPQGIFTAFIPATKAGEEAWRNIAAKTEGTGKVLSTHLPSVLSQLRKAGYTVAKAKPAPPLTKERAAKLLAELGI